MTSNIYFKSSSSFPFLMLLFMFPLHLQILSQNCCPPRMFFLFPQNCSSPPKQRLLHQHLRISALFCWLSHLCWDFLFCPFFPFISSFAPRNSQEKFPLSLRSGLGASPRHSPAWGRSTNFRIFSWNILLFRYLLLDFNFTSEWFRKTIHWASLID